MGIAAAATLWLKMLKPEGSESSSWNYSDSCLRGVLESRRYKIMERSSGDATHLRGQNPQRALTPHKGAELQECGFNGCADTPFRILGEVSVHVLNKS